MVKYCHATELIRPPELRSVPPSWIWPNPAKVETQSLWNSGSGNRWRGVPSTLGWLPLATAPCVYQVWNVALIEPNLSVEGRARRPRGCILVLRFNLETFGVLAACHQGRTYPHFYYLSLYLYLHLHFLTAPEVPAPWTATSTPCSSWTSATTAPDFEKRTRP